MMSDNRSTEAMGCCCRDKERCCSIWRITQSSIGIFVGLSSAFIFYHNYGNIQAAGWALASAIFATSALHLAILIHKKTINGWYTMIHLKNIQMLAFILTDIAVAAFVYYIFYAAYYRIPMIPVDNSAIVTSVWVFMTAKWTFLVWLFAKMGAKDKEIYEPISDSESI